MLLPRGASLPFGLPATTTAGASNPRYRPMKAGPSERRTVRGEELGCRGEPGPRHDGMAVLVITRAQYVLAPIEVVQVARGVFEAQLHVAEGLDHLAAPGVVD